MPNTTSSALPYPASTDAPNGPLQFQNLATALDRKVIPAFASLSARNTAIPSPTQGQHCTVSGSVHVYDGAAWRWQRRGFLNATTDTNGIITTPHGLGAVPFGVVVTGGKQATDLLDRILAFSVLNTDGSNFVVGVKRTDTSVWVASTQVQYSWIAFS